MLQLSLLPEEYVTINGNIVVQLADLCGGRASLRIEADRSIPIVRGKVLERAGQPRPACLNTPPRGRGKYRRYPIYMWSEDREQAVRSMEELLDGMEGEGDVETVELLRRQLKRLIPTVWEEEISDTIRSRPQSNAVQV